MAAAKETQERQAEEIETARPLCVGKKRSFDAAFKLKVVDCAEKSTNRGAAAKFFVDEKSVRTWRKNKASLLALPSKKKRIQGGGRKPHNPDMEEELLAWISDLRASNLRVTRTQIQRKAFELSEGGDFTASRGWLERFFERHSLSLRRRTTVSQRLPCDLEPKVTSFIINTRRLRINKKYTLDQIGNMDETPLWLDMPGETTVTHTGDRSVPIRSTGHEKGRFTVVLAAMADGRKLNPFVVFKGVRPIAELDRESGIIVAYSKNGWINEGFTKDWVKRGWGTLSFGRRLLIWDAYRCHIMDSVKGVVDNQAISDVVIIPGGLTALVQPADVSWNKPFKAAYKELYNESMVIGEKSYTAAGNVRAPSKLLCLRWVKKAWECVRKEIIIKSFDVCGISVSVDGKDDHKIHCIEDGEVAAVARPEIESKTKALHEPQDLDADHDDPFADVEEDEEELDTNECIIEDS